MAEFNPDYKEVGIPKAESYAGQAISSYEGNKAFGLALQGLGNLFGEGVKAADTYVKDLISNKLYDQASQERDNFTVELERSKIDRDTTGSRADVTNPMDANAQATDEEPAVPGEVGNLDGNVSNLQEARLAGKISTSEYWMRLNNIAKDMRLQYPGYREYIDQTITRITGHNPANAYMTSLMQDLTRGAAKTDSLMGKVESALIEQTKEGNRYAPALLQGVKEGRISPYSAMDTIAKTNQLKWDTREAKNQIDKLEAGAKGTSVVATNAASAIISNTVNDELINFKGASGLTSEKIAQNAVDALSGKTPADPEVAVRNAGVLRATAQSARNRLNTLFFTPDASGQTLANKIAPAGQDGNALANKMIDDGIKRIEVMADALAAKRPDVASFWDQQAEAMRSKDRFNAYGDKDFGTLLRMHDVLKNWPEAEKEVMRQLLTKNSGKDNDINAFIKRQMLSMLTETNVPAGKVVSIDEAIKKAKSMGIDTAKTFKDLVDFGTNILDPKFEEGAKYNLAAIMFHPNNQRLLENFNQDESIIGPDGKPRIVPGKYSVFAQYTSPAMAAEIKRLGEKHPEVLDWYKQWTTQSASTYLFGQEMRDLKDMTAIPGVHITWNTGDPAKNVYPKFDIEIDPESAAVRSMAQQRMGMRGTGVKTPIDRVIDTVQRLNIMTRSMANVSSTIGEDPNNFVLSLFKASGADTDFTKKQSAFTRDQFAKAVSAGIAAGVQGLKLFNPLGGSDTSSKDKRTSNDLNGSESPSIGGGPMQFSREKPVMAGIKEWQQALESNPQAPLRPEVKSSKRWWGDKEAEAAGLYEPAPTLPPVNIGSK